MPMQGSASKRQPLMRWIGISRRVLVDDELNMAEYAAWYASIGFSIFPLFGMHNGRCTCGKDCGKNAGKHPITKHGFLEATKDPANIAEWWRKHPQANIGLPTGTVNGGLFVL